MFLLYGKISRMRAASTIPARLNGEAGDAVRVGSGEADDATEERSGWISTKPVTKPFGVSRRRLHEYMHQNEL